MTSNLTTTAGACPPTAPSPLQDTDWTRDLGDSDHVRFFRLADWANSALGPLQQWSLALRLYVYQIMSDSRPAVMYWGPQKVAIYNEPFVPLAGKIHPRLMGIGFQDAYPEIWDNIKPVFDAAQTTKKAVDVVQIPLMVERSGYTEETYFTGNFNPLREVDGEVGGFYNALVEVTEQKLQDRRAAMLSLIAAHEHKYTPDTIGSHIEASLLTNSLDIPMAMLYQIDDDQEVPECSLTLRSSIGVPASHPMYIRSAKYRSGAGMFPVLQRAQSRTTTEHVGRDFGGIEWKGHGDACTSFSVLPLANGGRLYGYLVVGANPRRPIDHTHNQFMLDLSQRVSAAMASTFSRQQAHQRQMRLERGLAEREHQIRYMAQHASVAMVNVSLAGEIIWTNDIYYTIVGGRSGTSDHGALPFLGAVVDEDQAALTQAWSKLFGPETSFTLEVRMQRLYRPPVGDAVPATVLLSAFPYVVNGLTKSIMCCMTDVSRLKWAEDWQAREAHDAHQAKVRQIEFTDTISHEIRNPLSAIYQLADSIVLSAAELSQHRATVADCVQIIGNHVDAAKTILICARHQKRIVDDVLLLSKLDFTLTVLTPVSTHPKIMVDEIIRMLESNVKTDGIKLTCNHDSSLALLGPDHAMCDPLRVKQILINLLSNAIKFTKDQSIRNVTITCGAAMTDPRVSFPILVHWASKDRSSDDPTVDDGWGSGQPLYLTFSISDTGVGMSPEAIQRLFNRFEQVSPKTAVQYGGSGLGLFISEKLCRKQGGNIGVISEPGKGSTFVFYVKSRLAQPDPSGDATPQELDGRPQMISMTNDVALHLEKLNVVDSKPSTPAVAPEKQIIHLLLVEDNLVNQRILAKQLSRAGCVVAVANHGLEALEHLETSGHWTQRVNQGMPRLDIILMDCEMPVMDGLRCTRQIRDLERLPPNGRRRVPIVAVTANARVEQLEAALAAGIDRVVTKPFLIDELMTVIRVFLPSQEAVGSI